MSKPSKDTEYRRDYYRYASGFIVALVITYVAYFSVTMGDLSRIALAALLLTLAAIQLIVQMVVFLHVGSDDKSRWTLWSILYMLGMVLIIVVASLWIMANMNYNMHMTPEQMTDFMIEQNRKGF